MDDLIIRSIQEHTVLWVLISAGLGGIIGALIKFVFETVVALKYEQRVTARKMLRRYRYPLLCAANSLDRRLQNMIKFIEKKWYEDQQDDYYRLSTLFLFGSYLGWCKILEDAAYLEFEMSDRKAREFSIRFYRVFKALTGFWYFNDLDEGEIEGIEEATVPRLALTAIGELMLQNSSGNRDQTPKLLGFVEFSKRLKTSSEFRKWFGYLEKGILIDVKPSSASARWNRILVVASILRAFVVFLDPKSRQTTPRKIHYLKKMNPKVADRVRRELLEMNMQELIVSIDT
jgi:hypothetical protein